MYDLLRERFTVMLSWMLIALFCGAVALVLMPEAAATFGCWRTTDPVTQWREWAPLISWCCGAALLVYGVAYAVTEFANRRQPTPAHESP